MSAPHDLLVRNITKPIKIRMHAIMDRQSFVLSFIAYSLFFVSMQMVTGPSLRSSTFMSAPNSPVPTCLPIA